MDSVMKLEYTTVWVRDPRLHKDDFWHKHVDYEICLHTNSIHFGQKTSCVRRRYSDFVWLRNSLVNGGLIIDLPKLPKLPPWNPFFSLSNMEQVNRRMKGLQDFLDTVVNMPLLLSDSRLHLFLQSQLTPARIERCASGKTSYTVDHAIKRASISYSHRFPDEATSKQGYESDCESCASSGLGVSLTSSSCHIPFSEPSTSDPELCSHLSVSSGRGTDYEA